MPNCFPKWLYQFILPPVTHNRSCCFISFSTLGIVILLNFCQLNWCKGVTPHGLDLYFPDYYITWDHYPVWSVYLPIYLSVLICVWFVLFPSLHELHTHAEGKTSPEVANVHCGMIWEFLPVKNKVFHLQLVRHKPQLMPSVLLKTECY